MNGRRLGYDAARLELRRAQQEAAAAVATARVARADAARAVADRAAAKADAVAVAHARRVLRDAQLEARAAAARVKACRARLAAERAALSAGGAAPLDRVRERHDAVLARWMEYETDPARLLAFPQMSDGRHPATAGFLVALERARDLRPAASARMSVAEFSEYRSAVDALERAFDLAERGVRGGESADAPEALRDAARVLVVRTTEVLTRTSEVLGAWSARGGQGRRTP